MKITALLLLGVIIAHQSIRPAVDSSILVELGLLALFYFVGGRMIKEYHRSQERKRYLKGVTKRYMSKTEDKTWRNRSTTEVRIEKLDYFDKL